MKLQLVFSQILTPRQTNSRHNNFFQNYVRYAPKSNHMDIFMKGTQKKFFIKIGLKIAFMNIGFSLGKNCALTLSGIGLGFD